jgi:hypothetical protein
LDYLLLAAEYLPEGLSFNQNFFQFFHNTTQVKFQERHAHPFFGQGGEGRLLLLIVPEDNLSNFPKGNCGAVTRREGKCPFNSAQLTMRQKLFSVLFSTDQGGGWFC